MIRRRKKIEKKENPVKVKIQPHQPLPGWLVIRLEAPEDSVKRCVSTLNGLFKTLGHLDHQSTSALTGHRWYIRWSPQRLAELIQALGFEVMVE